MASVFSSPCVCVPQTSTPPLSRPPSRKPHNAILPRLSSRNSRHRASNSFRCFDLISDEGFLTHPFNGKLRELDALRARMSLSRASGRYSSHNAFVKCLLSRSRYRKCSPFLHSRAGITLPGVRSLQTLQTPECIAGFWKQHLELYWIVDLAEFWGILGSQSCRIVSASVSEEGHFEFSEGLDTQVLAGSRDASVAERDLSNSEENIEPLPGFDSWTAEESDNVGPSDDGNLVSDVSEGEASGVNYRGKIDVQSIPSEGTGWEYSEMKEANKVEENIEADKNFMNESLGEVATTVEVEAPSDALGASTRETYGSNWKELEDNILDTSKSSVDADDINKGTEPDIGLNDQGFRRKVVMAADAGAALALIAERAGESKGVVNNEDCSCIIVDAIAAGNGELAFSIVSAMRSSLVQRRVDREERGCGSKGGWQWAQPNVNTYATLVRGLAATLRVSDAIETVADMRRRGIPAGDEVPFGEVVSCPTCKAALAVVQPQQGVQVVPCANCRYQYELMSGSVVNCESESISMNISAFERSLRVLQLLKRPIPAAVHSLVIRTPDGLARTHCCATESADIPAQEGERVTVVSSAPANAGRGISPFKISARTPGWRPSEPMAITNHVTGRVSTLSRPPPKSGSGAAFDTSFIVPAALFLASSDAATALIDPSLPRAIAIGAAAAVALGSAVNTFVLPRLNQLPQRTVDAMALRQQLLAQHQSLQTRLEDLSQASADDVRMLARMCQLQYKMEAVGEPSYSARIERVRKAREGLDDRLEARLQLIDSYAKISSMIEIEVEMDVDVLAAESAGAAAIAEQIERLMDIEDLQKAWRLQAEANDEVERLLRSAPLLPESA